MKRRKFLMTTGTLPVHSHWPPRHGCCTAQGRNLLFVKVETDQGIHGIGEAYSCHSAIAGRF